MGGSGRRRGEGGDALAAVSESAELEAPPEPRRRKVRARRPHGTGSDPHCGPPRLAMRTQEDALPQCRSVARCKHASQRGSSASGCAATHLPLHHRSCDVVRQQRLALRHGVLLQVYTWYG